MQTPRDNNRTDLDFGDKIIQALTKLTRVVIIDKIQS